MILPSFLQATFTNDPKKVLYTVKEPSQSSKKTTCILKETFMADRRSQLPLKATVQMSESHKIISNQKVVVYCSIGLISL